LERGAERPPVGGAAAQPPRRSLVGLDLVEVARFQQALERHPGLERRVFTPAEIAYCHARGKPVLSLAARFAAKEAIGKLLGTGIVSWQEIEILAYPLEDAVSRQSSGGPAQVKLSGAAAGAAAALGVDDIQVSLSHVDTVAGASLAVVARSGGGSDVDGIPDIFRTGEPDDLARVLAGAGLSPSPGGAGGPIAASLSSEAGNLFGHPAVFTPAQMREMDRATIEDIGVPGPVLMERAALGVTHVVRTRFPGRHTLLVCGRGNNGGDGLAAARQLHLAGHPVACIVAAASPGDLSPEAALNYAAAARCGVNLRIDGVPDYLWDETELVVDCLLGTGATGELRGRVAEWAAKINAAGARGVPVIAVDVPSGVDASTGILAAGSVAADLTVTFHAAKTGLVCPPGSEAAGEIVVWDIGIPESLEPEPDLWVVSEEDVNIPGRRADDHKYRAGYVAVLAGSKAYPGAAWLVSQAAYRTGAGYVRLLMPAGAAVSMRPRLVETVLEEIGDGDILDAAGRALSVIGDARLGALVCGPGLGRDPATVAAVRRIVLESAVPCILDADGLFAFAGEAGLLKGRPGLVLTPHAGELAALLGEPVAGVTKEHLAAARSAAAATGQVVLLKGSSTVIASPDGEARAVVQGPPQLASAGTGDVLSGAVGALLAKGMEPFEAAYAAAWLHAEAGMLGAQTDPQGVLAGDLVELIPAVIADRIYERRPSWTN
jgi:ADP-dependent NAD(P)H-hydrate dehydratase / NAD(P)H-hydrate epimerase